MAQCLSWLEELARGGLKAGPRLKDLVAMKFWTASAMKFLVMMYLFASEAMLAKNKRPYDASSLGPEQRLMANVRDLFASNTLSAQRSQEVLNDVANATALRSFKKMKKESKGNVSRNLKKKFLKGNVWPASYKAFVRVKDLKSGQEVKELVSFLLPREFLTVLAKKARREVLMCRTGLDAKSLQHLESCEKSSGQELLGLGLWGDGVPVNWDRTESVETFSLNLPGQIGKYKPLRLPITALSRKQVTENTWTDVMDVIAWSLRYCSVGIHPPQRHDFAPWKPSDKDRAKLANKELPVRAALVEVRGDWKMFGEIFHFPKWNENAGICWRCPCKPGEEIPLNPY